MDELEIEQTSILSERLGGFLVQIYLQNSYFILELKKKSESSSKHYVVWPESVGDEICWTMPV